MGSYGQLLNLMLVVMVGWAGIYAIYTAIRLNREFYLFPNRFLYPANCPPDACQDVGGFISFMLPRLWLLGVLCLVVAVLMVVVNVIGVQGLPYWFSTYVLPFLGLAVFAWYISVNARAAKKFW